MRRVLREWRIELIMLLAVLIAIFLLVERLEIRSTVQEGLQAMASWMGGTVETIAAYVIPNSASDAIGMLLIVAVLLMARWRVRWRLLRTPSLASRTCPRCGTPLHRIHRTPPDRLLSVIAAPVRRFACRNPECRWTGLRVDASKTRHRSAAAEDKDLVDTG